MSNDFRGVGNLGNTPTLTPVTTDGETTMVANMRVYFDRRIPNAGGGYEDKGGFWLSVELWGHYATLAHGLLQKGARATFDGKLYEHVWTPEDGQPTPVVRLRADTFAISPLCIETLRYYAKREADSSGEDTGQTSGEAEQIPGSAGPAGDEPAQGSLPASTDDSGVEDADIPSETEVEPA